MILVVHTFTRTVLVGVGMTRHYIFRNGCETRFSPDSRETAIPVAWWDSNEMDSAGGAWLGSQRNLLAAPLSQPLPPGNLYELSPYSS